MSSHNKKHIETDSQAIFHYADEVEYATSGFVKTNHKLNYCIRFWKHGKLYFYDWCQGGSVHEMINDDLEPRPKILKEARKLFKQTKQP